MGVINFAGRRDRSEARFVAEHGAEMDALRRRIDDAPPLIDRAEAVATAVMNTVRALDAQDWDAAVAVVRATDAVPDGELDHLTLAHRDAVVGLLEETLDLQQARTALATVRSTAEAEVEDLFVRGERDLARLAELEQEQAAVAAGEPLVGAAAGTAPGAAPGVAAQAAPLVPPVPLSVQWGRRTEKRLPELWALAYGLLAPGEQVECVLMLARKRPPLDVLVITDRRFFAFDSAVVTTQGPEISHLREGVTKVSVVGFAERLVVTTKDGVEIDCGPLGHTGDRELAQQRLLPAVKMSWDE